MLKRRVVITGLGAITALGEGAQPLWEAVVAGRSGVDFINFDDESWKPIGATVKDFSAEKYITQRKALKVMARDIQLAVAASSLALDDAGVKTLELNRGRFGVIVGSGVLNHELDELAYCVQSSVGENGQLDLKKFGEEGLSALFPLWLLKYLPNMPACHISILFDLQGPNNTITTGASSGLQAVGEAYRIIERGGADMMLAGGAESKVNPVGLSQYKILGVLSESADPKKACKPFDAEPDGLVVGEGAGFLVLEDLEHAKKRNAKIYAEITGFGSSSGSGQKIAMKAALNEAGVAAGDIDYVQASGLGLEKEDLFEAEALEETFKTSKQGPFVSSSKPVVGFTGFASGALDLILSTLALQNQAVAPTLNFNKPKREWNFKIVKGAAVKTKLKNAMTNTFGFGGQSVSMVTKHYQAN